MMDHEPTFKLPVPLVAFAVALTVVISLQDPALLRERP
jgi:hypothetical protein